MRALQQQMVDAELRADIDTAFVTISGWLVFFMQAGFAMLSVGAVRSKNAKNMLLYVMLDATVGAVAFYLLGYGIAYGDTVDAVTGRNTGNGVIGTRWFALADLPYGEGNSQFYNWFFQYCFAATASTIVSGAVIERCSLSAYITYSSFLTAFVYPIVAHWQWSGAGWLAAGKATGGMPLFGSGMIDFAGCGAVHMVGGVAGIVGSLAVGPRLGRFAGGTKGPASPMPGHNVVFSALGTMILWFGWYGFNCGSAGRLVGASAVISRAAMSTTLGAAGGGVASTLLVLRRTKVWDLLALCNGSLAGLVSITAGCAFFEPWAALLVGALGGLLFPPLSAFLLSHGVDDPLEAGAMHAGCGAWGLLAAGLLSHPTAITDFFGPLPNGAARHGGGFYGGGGAVATAVVGVLVIAGWVAILMSLCFAALKRTGCLRVPEAHELAGMDESYHGGSAYAASDYLAHAHAQTYETAREMLSSTAVHAAGGNGGGGGDVLVVSSAVVYPVYDADDGSLKARNAELSARRGTFGLAGAAGGGDGNTIGVGGFGGAAALAGARREPDEEQGVHGGHARGPL